MKKVLVILPYEHIYPPVNGGMLRCFHLLHEMAKYFEVTAIMDMLPGQFYLSAEEYPAVRNIKVYGTGKAGSGGALSPRLQSLKSALLFRWRKRTWKGPADSSFLRYYPVLRQLLRSVRFDVVILENLNTLNAVSTIRRYQPDVRIIYDAHNVDTRLAALEWEKGLVPRKSYELTRSFEASLHSLVDLVIACSEQDVTGLKELNSGDLKGVVVPNGVAVPERPSDSAVDSDRPEHVLFCGSLDYEPNREGLYWFVSSIWPRIIRELPYLKLIVVGSGAVPEKLEFLKTADAVLFKGRVPKVQPFYDQAAVSIVPLKTGSGTRLKILEAMAFGVPVVSTSIGAEGIAYRRGKDILIADDEQRFAENVIRLMQQREERGQLRDYARQLVEKEYDWRKIGKRLKEIIETETHTPSHGKAEIHTST